MDAKYPAGPLEPRNRPRLTPSWSRALHPIDLIRDLDPGLLAWRRRGRPVEAAPSDEAVRKAG